MKTDNMNLEKLLEKRLIIVTGKGGVGKTTVALALSFLNAKYNRRSIVAMLKKIKKTSYFFGLNKDIDYAEKKLDKNIYAICINPNRALDEYIFQKFLRFYPFYSLVFKSKVIIDFFDAAPGLKELITIGKVWQIGNLKTSGKNPQNKYKQVIFDAPSTGHAIPILDLPNSVLKMIEGGPVREHVKRVEEFLKDPKKTGLVVVTTPEELAVKETIEIIEQTKQIGIDHTYIIINCVYPKLFDESDEIIVEKKFEEVGSHHILPLIIKARSNIKRIRNEEKRIKELYRSGISNAINIKLRFKGDLEVEDLKEISEEVDDQLYKL